MRNSKVAHFLRMWREDYIGQTFLRVAVSFSITVLFAMYHGYPGLCYGSVWHGYMGVFYLLLMVIRETALLTEKWNPSRLEREQKHCRLRTFLISSVLLLVMDVALIWPIAMTAYAIRKITMASIHTERKRRRAGGNIMAVELRTVNFMDALVAILTLQNTLIMLNRSNTDENAMPPVSSASSAIIYVVIVSIT